MAYAVTLPERMLRSASAVSAGLLREIGDVALPATLRRTLLYRTLVTSTLRFLIEQVGEVEGTFPAQGQLMRDFAIRRAAGNGIELLGLLAFRASPVWVMAALADLTGAGRHLIREIADSLKKEGLLSADAEFVTVNQILDGLEETSARIAETVNTPPLDVASLRREWRALRASLARIPPQRLPSPRRLAGQWQDLCETARAEGRSVFEVSTVMALAALEQLPAGVRWLSRSAAHATRRTGQVLAAPLLDHYSRTLEAIREAGFLTYWTRRFRPYLRAAAAQFTSDRKTLTERLVNRSETRRARTRTDPDGEEETSTPPDRA